MKTLPDLLRKDHGITVIGALERDYLEIVPGGKPIEMNMWGSGLMNGQPVEIVGEAKSQIPKSMLTFS